MTKHKYNKYSIPQLNHHSPQSRHSGPLGQVLPTSRRRWNSSSQKPAFTIIEVVLVLALAGLIFLMVFIALPALQRSQRDAQRKRNAHTILDAAVRKMANNRGNILADLEGWSIGDLLVGGYLKRDEIRDPSTGELYAINHSAFGGPLYTGYQNIRAGEYGGDTGGYCEGNVPVDISGTANGRSVVYVFGLEGGGWTCISNVMK